MTDPAKLTSEIIGFRDWTVTKDLGLSAVARETVWDKDVNTASCIGMIEVYSTLAALLADDPVEAHTAPAPRCGCGLYGLHAPGTRYRRGTIWGMVPDDGCELVRGLIAAWGQVEVHYDGFRAQYAKPVAIAIPQGKRDAAIARAVAAEYHLPTVPESELERVAGEFGSVVPEDLRPPKPAPPKGDFFALSQAMMQFTHSLQAMPPIIISTAEGLDPAKLQGPTPGDVIAEIRAKRPGYDPRRWIPKRKGGRR